MQKTTWQSDKQIGLDHLKSHFLSKVKPSEILVSCVLLNNGFSMAVGISGEDPMKSFNPVSIMREAPDAGWTDEEMMTAIRSLRRLLKHYETLYGADKDGQAVEV